MRITRDTWHTTAIITPLFVIFVVKNSKKEAAFVTTGRQNTRLNTHGHVIIAQRNSTPLSDSKDILRDAMLTKQMKLLQRQILNSGLVSSVRRFLELKMTGSST